MTISSFAQRLVVFQDLRNHLAAMSRDVQERVDTVTPERLRSVDARLAASPRGESFLFATFDNVNFTTLQTNMVLLVLLVLGENLVIWLECVMLLLLSQTRFDSVFGKPPVHRPRVELQQAVNDAWVDVRMPFYLLTSLVLFKSVQFSAIAFQLSLALRGRGLSNTGSELLASMTLTVPKSSYYRQRENLVKCLQQEHRSSNC